MRLIMCLFSIALLAGAPPVAASAARGAPEERLAKRLEGRVPGKPVNCIPQYRIQSSEIFEKTAILYKTGSTWYLNRPVSGKNFLGRDDILLTDTRSPDLCSVDIVRLLDQGSRFPSGSLGLGPFIPYTRPAAE